MLHKLPAVVLALAATAASGQEIYSWKDSAGRVHYSDMPPAEAKVRTLRKAPLAPEKAAVVTRASTTAGSLCNIECSIRTKLLPQVGWLRIIRI